MKREQELYQIWCDNLNADAVYAKELQDIANNPDEIQDRFYRDLEFGTAGLRGIMGLGTNRMNLFTVGRATQSLAQYLWETVPRPNNPSIAVAYDSRNQSQEFAFHAASILAANGVIVHLFPTLTPTPTLSYAIRQLGCDSGINITASHNPSKYNGYKVYGSDGCQIGTETATRVMELMMDCDLFQDVKTMPLEDGVSNDIIRYIPEELVEEFCVRVFREALQPDVCAQANLKIVYTPLNGTGRHCVLNVLKKAGAAHIDIVPEQEWPDGNFPTCSYPNPEMKEALTLGINLAQEKSADILLATDPDCDRLGVAVRTATGMQILSGNEVGILLLDYIASTRKKMGTLPQNPVTIRSIVSTLLTDRIATEYGVEVIPVLTGFKNIGAEQAALEEKNELDRLIFSYEESCGYLKGSYVRDKDGVNAVLMVTEMASAYKLEGKSLVDHLNEIFQKHGYFRTPVQNIAFEGAEGMVKMQQIMDDLRSTPPTEFAGRTIVAVEDYLTSVRTEGDKQYPIHIEKSNVLSFDLSDGGNVMIRPSGTEPKIKIYYSVVGTSPAEAARIEQEYTAHGAVLLG